MFHNINICPYQHCCPQVKLVKELGDEDVHLQDVCHVLPLHLAENVNEPFKLSVRLSDPEEVNFLAGNSGISVEQNVSKQV